MGICICHKFEESENYLNFLNSLKINTIKSEELILKIREKYLTIPQNEKEEKKKSALLNEIISLIDSGDIEYREYSQLYFMEYFQDFQKKENNLLFSLCFFCDSNSNFKKTFEEICTISTYYLYNFSDDKKRIKRKFLKKIVFDYFTFSTVKTIPFIRDLYGSNSTKKYMTELFDEETRSSIVTDLFQPFDRDYDDMIDIEVFFDSITFRRIINKNEILRLFETYYALRRD